MPVVEKCILAIPPEMVVMVAPHTRKIPGTPAAIATPESRWRTETGEKSGIAEADIPLPQAGRKAFSSRRR